MGGWPTGWYIPPNSGLGVWWPIRLVNAGVMEKLGVASGKNRWAKKMEGGLCLSARRGVEGADGRVGFGRQRIGDLGGVGWRERAV